jgi:hypothetical protein
VLVRGRENSAARGGSVEGENEAERGVPRESRLSGVDCVGKKVGWFDDGRLISIGGQVPGLFTGVEKAAIVGTVGTVALRKREKLFT